MEYFNKNHDTVQIRVTLFFHLSPQYSNSFLKYLIHSHLFSKIGDLWLVLFLLEKQNFLWNDFCRNLIDK